MIYMKNMQRKILKSKFSDTKLWDQYPVKVLPIKDIYISCPKTIKLRGKPFFENLKENTIRHWTVWGGSQRIRVAIELEYTHIDCAIIPSLDECRKLQGKMRAPFTKRYY